MDQFVGLDVSQEMTHLCVIGNDGKLVWQGKCLSTPEDIAGNIRSKAPDVVRIGLESGPLSTWHWHALKAMGLPVLCLDSRHAQATMSGQVNKTDKNDAYGLAQIVKAGWYREVGVKSVDSHAVRSMLGARAQLVGMRVEVTNQIRGILKTFGVILSRRTGEPFERLVDEACDNSDPMLNQTVRSMLCVHSCLKEQIRQLDRQLMSRARGSAVCRQLMAIPGVGVLTALAFVTAVDDPSKFAKSRSVGAHFGLTPRCYQSGEIDRKRGISKCGDSLVRTYLFEAAGTLLTRVEKWSGLKAWGLRIAKRSGLKKAKIAVARKLAVVMHRMWVDGVSFRWSAAEAGAVA
ncbi:IS110 family transposase [Mesorhizobium sp. M0222]|uniref:IS110 family transposase n=1 Tax=Mesorhizobium sp. M0222 TaxID=2956921 RepID=UPI00333B68DE